MAKGGYNRPICAWVWERWDGPFHLKDKCIGTPGHGKHGPWESINTGWNRKGCGKVDSHESHSWGGTMYCPGGPLKGPR